MTRTIWTVYKSHNVYLSLYAEGGITVSAQHIFHAWDDIDFEFPESDAFDSDESAFNHIAELITSAAQPDSEFEFNRLAWTEI